MPSVRSTPPVVALFAAADPTCGAGVFADIRAVAAQACVPLAVVCGVAPQNLKQVLSAQALSAKDIRAQFAAVEDAPVAAIKIGALFSPAAVRAVAQCLARKPNVPVVWDPVLAPTRGEPFADDETREIAKKLLLPRAAVITPNMREARALIGGENLAGPTLAAKKLMTLGAQNVVVTDSARRQVRCILYCQKKNAPVWQESCKRTPGHFHGTGCFFAATLAARVARGDSVPAAARRAHSETLAAIGRAVSLPALGGQKLIAP